METTGVTDPIEAIILKYSRHPSIQMITANVGKSTFRFNNVQLSDIEQELGKLDSTEGCKSNSMPAKFLKEYHSICSVPLFNIFKTSLNECEYDRDLKFADIAPVHKGEDATSKKIIVRLVYFQLSRKFMRKSYTNRLLVMQGNF